MATAFAYHHQQPPQPLPSPTRWRASGGASLYSDGGLPPPSTTAPPPVGGLSNLHHHHHHHSHAAPLSPPTSDVGSRLHDSGSDAPNKKKRPGAKVQRPKKYPCPSGCGAMFDRPCSAKQHNLTHTGERPHKCVCGTAFAARNNLYRHERKCRAYEEAHTEHPMTLPPLRQLDLALHPPTKALQPPPQLLNTTTTTSSASSSTASAFGSVGGGGHSSALGFGAAPAPWQNAAAAPSASSNGSTLSPSYAVPTPPGSTTSTLFSTPSGSSATTAVDSPLDRNGRYSSHLGGYNHSGGYRSSSFFSDAPPASNSLGGSSWDMPAPSGLTGSTSSSSLGRNAGLPEDNRTASYSSWAPSSSASALPAASSVDGSYGRLSDAGYDRRREEPSRSSWDSYAHHAAPARGETGDYSAQRAPWERTSSSGAATTTTLPRISGERGGGAVSGYDRPQLAPLNMVSGGSSGGGGSHAGGPPPPQTSSSYYRADDGHDSRSSYYGSSGVGGGGRDDGHHEGRWAPGPQAALSSSTSSASLYPPIRG